MSSRLPTRLFALGAAIAAGVALALVLFGGGGGDYQVRATFINAGQLVKGNQVLIGGVGAGSVKDISISRAGQAEVVLAIDDRHAPLPAGTRAVIRQASQSGIANRYVELRFGEWRRGRGSPQIADGGAIPVDRTETAVDLDQLLNTLDPRTRRSLQRVVKGSARQYAGRGRQAAGAFRYLSPALSQSSRVFNELNRDTPTLERFLVDSATLMAALGDRRDRLTDLVSDLGTTTRALARRKRSLASAIGRFPGFMRRANTSFVNLRTTLNELDPLVASSRPVARRLRPFLAELAPFARDARPAVRDASALVRRRGRGNDLVDLLESFGPLARIGVQRRPRAVDFGTGLKRVGQTEGALPEATRALRDSTPIVRFGRPYTPDLFGWFDDFSNTGVYDAIGGIARVQLVFGATSAQIPNLVVPDQLKDDVFRNTAKTGQYRRCPGAAEAPAADGSNVLSEAERRELDCREQDRAVGTE